MVALAAALRELVLASDQAISWQTSPGACAALTSDPGWATWVAAAVAAALAVALIVARRRASSGAADGGPPFIQFEDEPGWARLDVPRHRARHEPAATGGDCPASASATCELDKKGDVWRVIVTADVPARDLQALRARMHSMLSDDLQRTGGMRCSGSTSSSGSLDPLMA